MTSRQNKMQKALKIFLNSIPILIMIGLIPLVQNDYFLTLVYLVIIIILSTFINKKEKNDLVVFFFGLIVITFFEYVFIKTGVERFNRNSLFGLMPLWLPLLWAYGFVAIKKSLKILEQ